MGNYYCQQLLSPGCVCVCVCVCVHAHACVCVCVGVCVCMCVCLILVVSVCAVQIAQVSNYAVIQCAALPEIIRADCSNGVKGKQLLLHATEYYSLHASIQYDRVQICQNTVKNSKYYKHVVTLGCDKVHGNML